MYKNEIREALEQLELSPGGPVAGLLDVIKVAEPQIQAACIDFAANNDAKMRSGSAKLQEAIKPILQRASEISQSFTAVELHQLGSRFDEVLRNFPLLEPLLRPGRQALAALAGAFDVSLQQQRRPPSIVGLIAPGLSLATCYAHYSALKTLYAESEEWEGSRDSSAIVEIAGAERLAAFADYITLLSILAEAAKSATRDSSEEPSFYQRDIRIISIESGSPIRINLVGGAKTIRLMLAMLREIVRVPYQHFSAHGRVVQTFETFARAKELGVESPAVLAQLEAAMVAATRSYANAVREDEVTLAIDGEPVHRVEVQALPAPDESSPEESNGSPRLTGPTSD